MFESTTFNVFVFVGTVASILSLIIGLWRYRKIYQLLNVLTVVGLTVFASYSYFRLEQARSAERALASQRELAQKEASELLQGLPDHVNLFDPGASRGIALSALAFLEKRQHLYPETFKLARDTVQRDIEAAQADPSNSEVRMQSLGSAMLSLLQSLAGGRNGGTGS
jgi:hypothetical protein